MIAGAGTDAEDGGRTEKERVGSVETLAEPESPAPAGEENPATAEQGNRLAAGLQPMAEDAAGAPHSPLTYLALMAERFPATRVEGGGGGRSSG